MTLDHEPRNHEHELLDRIDKLRSALQAIIKCMGTHSLIARDALNHDNKLAQDHE